MELKMLQIGQRIKETRNEQNISALDLANKVGLNKATIHRYEKGEFQSIKLPVLESIANVLHVNPSWLICKSEDKYCTDNLVELNDKDQKEIDSIIDMTTKLLQQDGLMFDGDPADKESIESIIDAMQIGLELAKRRNKQKYTPKKLKK